MARPASIQPIRMKQQHLRFCLYAEPGVGKTPFIGKSPRCLILDADKRTESAAIAGSNADVWEIDSHNDMLEAHEYLRNEDHDYLWTWLDSGTLFQDVGMADLMSQLIARKPERNQYIPDQPQYLENMNRFLDWVRMMHALPIHFGITAHEMRIEYEDEETEETIVRMMPAFAGKKQNIPLTQHICGYMNLVGRLTKKKKEGKFIHTLRCEPHGIWYAKDSWSAIGTMKNPSMKKIMEAIEPIIQSQDAKTRSRKKKTTKKKRRR